MHSAVLPYAVEYNEKVAKTALDSVARILGAANASQGVWELSKSIGAEQALKNIGFKSENIEKVSEYIMKSTFVNPRPSELEGIKKLLTAANSGSKPELKSKISKIISRKRIRNGYN